MILLIHILKIPKKEYNLLIYSDVPLNIMNNNIYNINNHGIFINNSNNSSNISNNRFYIDYNENNSKIKNISINGTVINNFFYNYYKR